MIRTQRYNDPPKSDDGTRILVTRYRPRGVAKADETWDEWWPQLGPSKALHAAAYGKTAPAINFAEYRARYLDEMQAQTYLITALKQRVASGERITLLCSSHCIDENACHRTLLRDLIEP